MGTRRVRYASHLRMMIVLILAIVALVLSTRAVSCTPLKANSSIEARMAMIATVTISSTSVNARRTRDDGDKSLTKNRLGEGDPGAPGLRRLRKIRTVPGGFWTGDR